MSEEKKTATVDDVFEKPVKKTQKSEPIQPQKEDPELKIEIDNYLEILTSEVSLSNEIHSENSIKNSMFSAIEFVKSKQQDNGCWREYINQGGISNTWSTAFILSKILSLYFNQPTAAFLGWVFMFKDTESSQTILTKTHILVAKIITHMYTAEKMKGGDKDSVWKY